jgi:hypothetical protein
MVRPYIIRIKKTARSLSKAHRYKNAPPANQSCGQGVGI